MKKYLLFFSFLLIFFANEAMAQPAIYSVPFSIGRGRCGVVVGGNKWVHPNGRDAAAANDSLSFFNYTSLNLSRNTLRDAYIPRLRVGNTSFSYSGNTIRDRFTIWRASVSFNPRDGKIYYLYTDYDNAISPTLKTYIWRWNPDTTFSTGTYNNPPLASLVDTLMSFNFDIGGITFDNNGLAWQLEFTGSAPNFTSYLRRLDFVNRTIDLPNQIDIINGPGGRGKLYNVNSGDITLLPNGQMYYLFNNKLYTPDYGSYQNVAGNHINSTCLDTITGGGTIVGLAFGDGNLIGAYSPGCVYKKVDPIPNPSIGVSPITYTYALNKGVASNDLAQISSGVGAAKKLVSITPTGTPKQYDVVYDLLVKNYGTVPINNLQVTDNLANINGLANLSNVSTTLMTIPPPPGIALNTAFNGSSDINLLQSSGQRLANYPVDSASFVIRINCTISNVDEGVVYYNRAIATANGFKNVALRDSSTNGDVPDLNQNDKPDDIGESIPTPFLIALKPIPGACGTLTATLYSENFGVGAIGGTGLLATLPTTPNKPTSTYTGTVTQPLTNNQFAITTNAQNGNTTNWRSLTDRTTANGRFMVFNADNPPRILFRDTLPTSCPGRQYSFSFWATFPFNPLYQSTCNALGGFTYPKLKVQFRDIVTGLTAVGDSTPTISSNGWTQIGYRWTMPQGYSNLVLEILNDAPGGCGNDIAIDDIVYGSCDALPVVNTSSLTGCLGDSIRFVGSLSDSTVLPGPKDHQWQIAPALAGPWVDIPGATLPYLVINPIAPADTGKFYRLIVAAHGSIAIPICRSTSPGVKLNGQTPSAAPTSAGKNKNNICPGIVVKIYRTGGTLGNGASWKWYTGSPGGTLVGTGDTLAVTPAVTTTYYIRAEGLCNTTAAQAVTVFISCDIDKDDDGIPDYIESNIAAAVANGYNTSYPGYKDINNDFINDDFQADGDSDNDGIANYLDPTFSGRIDLSGPLGVPDGIDDRFDFDLDGKINMLDLDSDNDGIADVAEAYGVDADGDGKIDNFSDTDGDGLSQNVDANNTGANNSSVGLGLINFDNDPNPNFLDLDSDNDGIPDVVEVGGPDANNNGKIDGFVDTNGDGLHDGYFNATALLKTGADTTSDGRADSYPNKNFDTDLRPNVYDRDSDADGIADVKESGLPDADLNGIIDGAFGANGWAIIVSSMPSLVLRNTDTDINLDYLDIDSDNDGITDNIEGQTTSGYILPTLADGDGDGIANVYDNIVGFAGAGVLVCNIDGDPFPDYIDLDTDGDGQIDRVEGNDFNFNGMADDLITLTGIDTDGDGLDDRFDNDSTSIKATSAYMGTGGTLFGQVPPGTTSVVQKKTPPQPDRDWRFVGVVLPVQFLQFIGTPQGINVLLNWVIITEKDIDRFEIERSTNNNTYTKVGTLTKAVQLNIQQGFAYTDDISGVNSDVIYYRLKVIGKAGEVKYSNVLVVRKSTIKAQVSIMPNPAKDYVAVRLYTNKDSEASFRLIDMAGKTVLIQTHKVLKGNNTVQINDLRKFSNGTYILQITVNGETTSERLILAK